MSKGAYDVFTLVINYWGVIGSQKYDYWLV